MSQISRSHFLHCCLSFNLTRGWIYSYWRPDLDFASLCENLSGSLLSSHTEKNCCTWGKNIAFAFKHLHLGCAVSPSVPVCVLLTSGSRCGVLPNCFQAQLYWKWWLTSMCLSWDASVRLKKLRCFFILVSYALIPKSLRYRSSSKISNLEFYKLRDNCMRSIQ